MNSGVSPLRASSDLLRAKAVTTRINTGVSPLAPVVTGLDAKKLGGVNPLCSESRSSGLTATSLTCGPPARGIVDSPATALERKGCQRRRCYEKPCTSEIRALRPRDHRPARRLGVKMASKAIHWPRGTVLRPTHRRGPPYSGSACRLMPERFRGAYSAARRRAGVVRRGSSCRLRPRAGGLPWECTAPRTRRGLTSRSASGSTGSAACR